MEAFSKAVEAWVQNLGKISGDTALIRLCWGGLFIAGGMALAMKD